jgi:thiol-disulfide isomerase/thioredoxin
LVFQEKKIQVFVNDNQMLDQPLNEKDRQGRGIILSVQGTNGNAKKALKNLLTLSDFKVVRSEGSLHGLRVDQEKMQLLLTVPRMRKKSPPTHVLVARNGDLLRGRLIGVSGDHAHFISKLADFSFPRDRLAGIIWLDPVKSDRPPFPNPAKRTAQAVLSDGTSFTFVPDKVVQDKLVGRSEVLGRCSLPISLIHELLIGDHGKRNRAARYGDWKLRPAKEPQFLANSSGPSFSGEDFGIHSPLVGTIAKDFEVKLLDEGSFRLSEHSDKVVILDFWATWCGPCVRSMPEVIKTVKAFPRDKVISIAVNQQESEKVVREFLKARGLDVTVALDKDGRISQQFQADRIPQIVIIGPGGKIERLSVGAPPNLEQQLKNALQKILDDSPQKSSDPPDDPADEVKESSKAAE